MKAARKAIFRLVVLPLLLNCAGCAVLRRDVVKPPGGKGYGVVVYWHGFVDVSNRKELHYWTGKWTHKALWRQLTFDSLYDDKNDLAFFHGWLELLPLSSDRQASRFFGVTGPGPVADIGDEIILIYTKARGNALAEAVKAHAIGRVNRHGENYMIDVGRIGGQWGSVELTRVQILQLIRDAKEKGRLLKDPRFGTPYYKRDVMAESPTH